MFLIVRGMAWGMLSLTHLFAFHNPEAYFAFITFIYTRMWYAFMFYCFYVGIFQLYFAFSKSFPDIPKCRRMHEELVIQWGPGNSALSL